MCIRIKVNDPPYRSSHALFVCFIWLLQRSFALELTCDVVNAYSIMSIIIYIYGSFVKEFICGVAMYNVLMTRCPPRRRRQMLPFLFMGLCNRFLTTEYPQLFLIV